MMFNVFFEQGDDMKLSMRGSNTDTVGLSLNEQIVVSQESNMRFATTEEWNSQREMIAERNVVYVYTDHETTTDGKPVPGFKVGDGLAYLIDLPFNDDISMGHIQDDTVHVSSADREFWNNKVTAYLNVSDLENLILTKE